MAIAVYLRPPISLRYFAFLFSLPFFVCCILILHCAKCSTLTQRLPASLQGKKLTLFCNHPPPPIAPRQCRHCAAVIVIVVVVFVVPRQRTVPVMVGVVPARVMMLSHRRLSHSINKARCRTIVLVVDLSASSQPANAIVVAVVLDLPSMLNTIRPTLSITAMPPHTLHSGTHFDRTTSAPPLPPPTTSHRGGNVTSSRSLEGELTTNSIAPSSGAENKAGTCPAPSPPPS